MARYAGRIGAKVSRCDTALAASGALKLINHLGDEVMKVFRVP
jgi:hypothetical protein